MTFANWVHSDVIEILLQVKVVSDDVIEESSLPQPLLKKMPWLNVGPVLQLNDLRSQRCSPVHQCGD